ncbi:MAG: outer membrane lipoprotein carrier protein LolA [Alphaproteobacteria bacterium]|nr:outer membrane lipoprotein carrier protein LolA [Alphaproteobacteria bacterium]
MKKLGLFLMMCGLIIGFSNIGMADIDKRINTPQNRAILKKVETAYNQIRTLKGKFAQFSSETQNDLQTGELYLSRPGQMRLVYEKGSPLEFYANNGYLIYHDKDLKEVNYFHLDQTPVSLILKQTLRFDDPEFLVTDVRDILDEYYVTAIKKDARELGSLTLIIDKETLQLKQWDVVDIEGVKSTVSLYETQFNVPLDKKIFLFHNPYQKKRQK